MKVDIDDQRLTIAKGMSVISFPACELGALIKDLQFSLNQLKMAGKMGALTQLEAILEQAEVMSFVICTAKNTP
jgi:hypothetical protein